MASELIRQLQESDFDDAMRAAEGPVLVDFWAPWCGPCNLLAPTLDEVASEVKGRATVAKVNVDDNGDLAARFGIRSIPTLVLFRDGRVVEQAVGVKSRDELLRMIERHAA